MVCALSASAVSGRGCRTARGPMHAQCFALKPSSLCAQAVPRRRRRPRALPGLHTDSDSGSGDGDEAAGAPPLADGDADDSGDDDDNEPLQRGALLSRRLARTRAALALYRRLQLRLLERLRERHRRFVVRHGHIGSRESAHAAAARREAMRQLPHAAPCAVPGCGASALALCSHCFAHVCLEPKQLLYVPGPDGAPQLRTRALPAGECAAGAPVTTEPTALEAAMVEVHEPADVAAAGENAS